MVLALMMILSLHGAVETDCPLLVSVLPPFLFAITVSGKVIVASKALPSLAASVSSRLPKSKKSGADGGGPAPRQRHVIF